MWAGFLQTEKIVAFNQERHRFFMNPRTEEDVMISRKAFTGTDFPGFICKDCGIVVFDYKNGLTRG